MRVLGLNHRNRWKIFLSLLLQNHLPQVFEIWFVALPGGLLCAMYRPRSFFNLKPMSVIVKQFQTVRFIQMMSLPFGLFTQVSGSGPLGPLVYQVVSNCYPSKS